jgi:hypothetical protein
MAARSYVNVGGICEVGSCSKSKVAVNKIGKRLCREHLEIFIACYAHNTPAVSRTRHLAWMEFCAEFNIKYI